MPVLMNAAPLKEQSGHIAGAVCSFQELTERKRTEEALRASEAERIVGRFDDARELPARLLALPLFGVVEERGDPTTDIAVRVVLGPIGYAIISKDLNGVIVSWNPGARRLFGYSAAEVVGKSVTVIIPEELQDQEPVILGRIRRGERIDHFETFRRCKDGRLVDISLTVSPMKDERGKIVGASKIARDITARKQAESVLAKRVDEQAAVLQLHRQALSRGLFGGSLRGGLGCDRCGAALQPGIDPALRPRWGHALRRLARLDGSLSEPSRVIRRGPRAKPIPSPCVCPIPPRPASIP
jgi:PAS domain S-box-containing protein